MYSASSDRVPGRKVTEALMLSMTSVCQFHGGGPVSKELRKTSAAESCIWALLPE